MQTKSTQALLLLVSALLALAAVVEATSRQARQHSVTEASFIVVDAEPAEAVVQAPTSSESTTSTSALPPLMMLGFLTVIAGMLFHWSKDSSCHRDRSVF